MKLSCRDLDQRSALPSGTSSALESAQIGITPGLLARLAQALDVDPGYFFETAQTSPDCAEASEIAGLLDAFSSIDEATRREVLDLVRDLAENEATISAPQLKPEG